LVAAMARHDDPRRAFRIFVEGDHVGGQPPHRPHEQEMQGQVDKARGEDSDQEAHDQEIAGETEHRLPQRPLIDHGLHQLRAGGTALSSTRVWWNGAPPGGGRMRRMEWFPPSSIVRNEPVIASQAVSARVSMLWSIAAGSSALARSRRCWPILIATARAPML